MSSFCQSAFTSDTDAHDMKNIFSPSFPLTSSSSSAAAAVSRTGCGAYLRLTFMKLSSRLFCLALPLCLFLIRSTTLSGKEVSVFRPWVSRSSHRPRPSLSMPWHRLQRDTHVHAQTHTHAHTHAQSSRPCQLSPKLWPPGLFTSSSTLTEFT